VKATILKLMRRWLPSTWIGWFFIWLLLVLVIVGSGAAVGGLAYPFFGTLLGMDLSMREFFVNGVKDGGFYALIWAPGISLVVCIMAANWKMRDAAR
jgi:hypothetical protein